MPVDNSIQIGSTIVINQTVVTVLHYVNSILDYNMLNLEVPTLHVVGSIIKAGVRVLIYR